MGECKHDELAVALEDYVTRMDRGERPDPEEYVRRYPSWEQELRTFIFELSSLRAMLLPRGVIKEMNPTVMPATPTIETTPDAGLPQLQGFRLIRELGNGSQGLVFLAEQLSTRRQVALKVLREGAFASSADRRRFETEVQLASRLHHPCVVSIYECGRDAGRDFFAMEYVEGEPLDVYCKRMALDVRPTVELFLRICGAISYAHQKGVIHRDLKPSNILVDSSGQPHVMDFGLAKPVVSASTAVEAGVTQVGDFTGTWTYASPEQARLEPSLVDVRSDVYTLGVILFEMLTDCAPFPLGRSGRESIIRHILTTPPLRPSAIVRAIDGALDAVVLKALRKEPDHRYQSAAAFGEDLERYLSGDAVEALRTHTWYVLSRVLLRHRRHLAAVAAGVTILTGFAITAIVLYTRADSSQATTSVRMDVVRDSAIYTLDKLDELHGVSNRLHELQASIGHLPEFQAILRSDSIVEAQTYQGLQADAPPALKNMKTLAAAPLDAALTAWLGEREPILAQLAADLRHGKMVFSVKPTGKNDPILNISPKDEDQAVRLIRAMILRGLEAFRRAEHSAALESFSAARSIALSLSDGRLLDQKLISSEYRAMIDDALLHILEQTRGRPHESGPYTRWVLADTPLAELRLGLIMERSRLADIVARASVGNGASGQGRLDLDLLDQRTDGLYLASRMMSDELRVLAASIEPGHAMRLIDQYMREAETWDGSTQSELSDSGLKLGQILNADPAWRLLKVMVPKYNDHFARHLRSCQTHAAVRLAAAIVRAYEQVGDWPETPAVVGAEGATIDPWTGKPFVYFKSEEGPLLYSFNYDGENHGGRPGRWGEPDTDIVYLGKSNSSR